MAIVQARAYSDDTLVVNVHQTKVRCSLIVDRQAADCDVCTLVSVVLHKLHVVHTVPAGSTILFFKKLSYGQQVVEQACVVEGCCLNMLPTQLLTVEPDQSIDQLHFLSLGLIRGVNRQ